MSCCTEAAARKAELAAEEAAANLAKEDDVNSSSKDADAAAGKDSGLILFSSFSCTGVSIGYSFSRTNAVIALQLFKTGNIEIVRECQAFFGFKLPSVLLNISSDKFIRLYDVSDIVVCTSLRVN